MEEIIARLEKAKQDNEKVKIADIIKNAKEIGIDPPKIIREIIKKNLHSVLV